jgi:hypothetical protein
MGHSTLIFDARPWWQPPRRAALAAAAASLLAGAAWWAGEPATAPIDAPKVQVDWAGVASPFAPVLAGSLTPATALPAAAGAAVLTPLPPAPEASYPARPLPSLQAPEPSRPPSSASISTMVAPGVHFTPMSVPQGTVAVPAGPSVHDSEPEN